MIALADIWQILGSGENYILLALGLGFVIFFHELGHFLAAKYCGVPVEQFAVGFGPAIFAWRRGIGFRAGSTARDLEKRLDAHLEDQKLRTREPISFTSQQLARALSDLGIGETEYRLNWMPLGGYVKMIGQDDLHPDAQSSDPRAYNNKPIRQRMLIVSAGVVMNILLAAIGFMIVFLMGFKSPPAEVGSVLIDSPAANATTADGKRVPLASGDRILSYNAKTPHDFAELALNVVLSPEGQSIPIVVRHVDGATQTLYVTPQRPQGEDQGLLSIGVLPAPELRGVDPSEKIDDDLSDHRLFPSDMQDIKPGESIIAINGVPVDSSPQANDYWMLDRALSQSDGNDVAITIKAVDGSTRQVQVSPHFQTLFGTDDLSFAGMVPRLRVASVLPNTPAYGQVLPGDVIEAIVQQPTHILLKDPSHTALTEAVNGAGQQDQSVILTLCNSWGGNSHDTSPIIPNYPLPDNRRGLGIGLAYDERNTVVADVQPDSPAQKAGITPGSRLTQINGQPVSTWFQVRSLLAQAAPGQPLTIDAATPDGKKSFELTLDRDQIDAMKFLTLTSDLSAVLRERTEMRKTANPFVAAAWGVSETRDFVLQFYVTLRRMFTGSVSYKQAMGPVGIVRFGAASAARGTDWLVWFLAMISANLAVVNFLPIPVVDGGLFVLLIVEAIKGKPLSANTQKIIQFVGLALILSVFLLVTYQDITRPFGHG